MKKYALVVGISQYADPEITDLSFAARDAEEVGQCLVEVCGFDEVRTLASGGDYEPDHVNVVDALCNLAPLLSQDDLFLFYFAGHGIEAKSGARLLTSNSRIRMPELASVSMEVLSDCLSRIECADRVLILDACRNDPRKGMGDEDNLLTSGFSRDIMAMAETPVEGVVPTTCVLFSCRPGERAYEWPDMQHGAFSHYLLEGLRGAAADGSGRITVQGLGQYVESQVPRWAKKARTPRPQTPWGEQKGSWREVLLAARLASAPDPEPRVVLSQKNVAALDKPAVRLESAPSGQSPTPERKPKVHIPDFLEPVADAQYARLGGLNAGSEAAQKRQMQWVQKGYPLEAVMKETGIVFCLVPPGEFQMGASPGDSEAFDDEKPQHKVAIPSPLYVAKFPVTQQQWQAVMGQNPAWFHTGMVMKKGGIFKQEKRLEADTKEHPVERVSWEDCQGYLNRVHDRLDLEFGKAIRLPTEAEWEYACRAGTTDSRYGNLDAIGWFGGNSGSTTHPVGQKRPNAWGLHDMIGNVYEWCEDNWHGGYKTAPCDGSAWPGCESARVVRGGSWYHPPQFCRSSYRYWFEPDIRLSCIGFRVVVDLE